MKSIRRQQSGQVLVLAAIAMVVLMGFLALAVDVGLLWARRRQMQTAADAATVAAAVALRSGDSYQTAAKNVSSLNGFADGQNGVTVTVNNPPQSGAYAGNQSYVEVVVDQPQPAYFLRVLGYSTVDVSARAAGGGINGPACVYALNPTKSGAIGVTGNVTINAACGMMDNSNSSSGLSAVGNATITATSIGVVGNYSGTGNVTFTPAPITQIAPASDPLSGRAPPSVATCTQQASNQTGNYSVSGNNQVVTVPTGIYSGGISIGGNNSSVTFSTAPYGNGISIGGNNGSVTFTPGQYQSGGSGSSITIQGNAATTFNAGTYTFCGGVSIAGNNAVTLSPGLYSGGISITGNATVTFNPGTYILAGGGLSVSGNSTLTGTGVTFYNTTGPGGYQPINLTGNERANLSAPTSGPLEGILFFQDRSIASGSTGSTIAGNASSTFDGVLYFPTTSVTYVGNSSGSGYTFLVADSITMTGNASLTFGNNYSSLSNGSPIKSSALYE